MHCGLDTYAGKTEQLASIIASYENLIVIAKPEIRATKKSERKSNWGHNPAQPAAYLASSLSRDKGMSLKTQGLNGPH